LRIDHAAIKREPHLDGKWLLRTSDLTLTPDDLAAADQQLTPLVVERDNLAGWTSAVEHGGDQPVGLAAVPGNGGHGDRGGDEADRQGRGVGAVSHSRLGQRPADVGCRLRCGVVVSVLVVGGGEVGDGLAARCAVVASGTTREGSRS
jgi:hypothetical protein